MQALRRSRHRVLRLFLLLAHIGAIQRLTQIIMLMMGVIQSLIVPLNVLLLVIYAVRLSAELINVTH